MVFLVWIRCVIHCQRIKFPYIGTIRWWTAYSVGEMVDEMHTALVQEFGGQKNGYLSATIGIVSALSAFFTGHSRGFVRRNSFRIVISCMLAYQQSHRSLFPIIGFLIVILVLRPYIQWKSHHDRSELHEIFRILSLYMYCHRLSVIRRVSDLIEPIHLKIITSFRFRSAVSASSIISVALPKSLRGLTMFTNTFFQLLFQCIVQAVPQCAGWTVNQKFMMLACILWTVCIVILIGSRHSKLPNLNENADDEDSITAEARCSHVTAPTTSTIAA